MHYHRLNFVDTRFAIAFSLSAYTHNFHLHTLPRPAPVISRRPTYGEIKSEDETQPLVASLNATCARHDLQLQMNGRFFLIVDPASNDTLKGFLMPKSTEWCWFYTAKGSPKTIHFAQVSDAETYIKVFFVKR